MHNPLVWIVFSRAPKNGSAVEDEKWRRAYSGSERRKGQVKLSREGKSSQMADASLKWERILRLFFGRESSYSEQI